jgi:hypothetical protein
MSKDIDVMMAMDSIHPNLGAVLDYERPMSHPAEHRTG